MPRFSVTVEIVVDCDTPENAIYYATEVLADGIGTIDDFSIIAVDE
jgi:hypothetical protein